MTVRGVTFDWGGTLVEYLDGRGEEVVSATADECLPSRFRGPFVRALMAHVSAYWHDSSEDLHTSNLESLVVDALRDSKIAPTENNVRVLMETYLRHYRHLVKLNSAAIPVLRELSLSGFPVGIVSNTLLPSEYLRHVNLDLGVAAYVEVEVYSSDLPFRKPHPLPFIEAAETMGLGIHEMVHVGDRMLDDVAGAHSAGLRTVLVPNGVFRDSGPVVPDVELTSLAQLPDYLMGGM